MSEPVKEKDGWYVETPDGKSGPWLVKAAAQAAADDNLMQANMINSRAITRDKVYKGQRR